MVSECFGTIHSLTHCGLLVTTTSCFQKWYLSLACFPSGWPLSPNLAICSALVLHCSPCRWVVAGLHPSSDHVIDHLWILEWRLTSLDPLSFTHLGVSDVFYKKWSPKMNMNGTTPRSFLHLNYRLHKLLSLKKVGRLRACSQSMGSSLRAHPSSKLLKTMASGLMPASWRQFNMVAVDQGIT